MSVEGKEIEGHYVLAKEFVQKWNSTSDCYLLVEGVERTLTVNYARARYTSRRKPFM